MITMVGVKKVPVNRDYYMYEIVHKVYTEVKQSSQ